MENVRKRFRPLKWVTTAEAFLKEASKPSFYGNVCKYSESLLSLQHVQTEVTLNKPIQIGQAILDISKVLMFDFHYDVMMPRYGHQRLKLLMTDTDSLYYQISSPDPTFDVYADLAEIKEHFDFSDYPKGHPLYCTANKKIAGKMKDDKATLIIEQIGIRAKMYSTLTARSEELAVGAEGVGLLVKAYEEGKADKGFVKGVKRLTYLRTDKDSKELVREPMDVSVYESHTTKGIKKSVAQAELRHHHFKDCLLNDVSIDKVRVASLRSVRHRTFLFDSEKATLDPLDDKRHILPNGCDTLAHGHCRIASEY